MVSPTTQPPFSGEERKCLIRRKRSDKGIGGREDRAERYADNDAKVCGEIDKNGRRFSGCVSSVED